METLLRTGDGARSPPGIAPQVAVAVVDAEDEQREAESMAVLCRVPGDGR